jgi:hypothetical protein
MGEDIYVATRYQAKVMLVVIQHLSFFKRFLKRNRHIDVITGKMNRPENGIEVKSSNETLYKIMNEMVIPDFDAHIDLKEGIISLKISAIEHVVF